VFLQPDGREFVRNEGVLEREDIRNIFSKMGVEAAKASQIQGLKAPGARQQLSAGPS
jgi:hypothetical protein